MVRRVHTRNRESFNDHTGKVEDAFEDVDDQVGMSKAGPGRLEPAWARQNFGSGSGSFSELAWAGLELRLEPACGVRYA